MKANNLILVTDFCALYELEPTFLLTLRDSGLIAIISENDMLYLNTKELSKIEKILLFYNELEINLEGIEVIMNLLNRIERLQNEMYSLRNQLDQNEL